MPSIARLAPLLLLLVISAEAFSPIQWGIQQQSRLKMFSADEQETKPLETAETQDTLVQPSIAGIPDADQPKMTVRNMNTGELREVRWVDPAMSANTNPFQMNWWAYILFGFPFIILADDFFHFLPEDGPAGFLSKF